MGLVEIRPPDSSRRQSGWFSLLRRKPQPEQVVAYERPERPTAVRILWWLVLAAAVAALISAGSLFLNLHDVSTQTTELRLLVTGEGTDDEPIVAGDDPLAQQLRDGVRVVDNVAGLLFVVVMGVMFYIPALYFILLRRIPSGDPRVLRRVRQVARYQFIFEIVKHYAVFIIGDGLESMTFATNVSPSIALAPAILILARRQEVKRFFSVHGYEAVSAVEPAGVTDSSGGNQWIPVPDPHESVAGHARDPIQPAET